VEKVSRQLKDQQNSPIDSGVYWTEYVLRHDKEDLARLKPLKVFHSYWFQSNLLDVWIFLLCTSIAFLYLSFFMLKWSFFYWTNRGTEKLKKN